MTKPLLPFSTQTDTGLLEQLAVAAGKPVSSDEVKAQRVSWCLGQTGLDRKLIRATLAASACGS